MISINKNIARRACCGFAAALALTACSDFSDYNETPVDQTPSGNLSLWENIQQNGDLSDFAQLVRRTGFDSVLSTPRSLTVWAPLNGTFSLAELQNLSDNDLLTQFVKNHIAEYSHAASGAISERVHTLNDKSYTFELSPNGGYTFGGQAINRANVPSTNGLIHLLSGAAHFYPNLYEYLRMGQDIDSLRDHIMRYEQRYLDTRASVKGPMVDGVQTYIDSVMVTYNTLVNQLGASLENEDSSYTFVMPTNEAFMEMYNRVRPLYRFIATTTVHDVESYSSATSTNTKSVSLAEPGVLTDSLTRMAIVRNLIFSNNDGYNKWVVGKGDYTDTLRTLRRSKFSNPHAIINDHLVGEPQEMSNGYARLVDSLAFLSWETYNPMISVNPRNHLAKLFPLANTQQRTATLPDSLIETVFGPNSGIVSNYRYLWIQASGDRTLPTFFVTLPEVKSTTYNFYVVFMPSAMRQVGNDPRPNWLNFELNYCQANGKTATYIFGKAYADSLLTGGKLPSVPTKVNTTTAFKNDPEKTDTVFIGRFTFPVAYSGLGNYYPSIKVTTPIDYFNKTQLATYNRDVRIAAFLLKPVELDEYEAKNK